MTFDSAMLFEHMQIFHRASVRPRTENPSTDPTPEELEDVKLACSKLWSLDSNRLVPGEDFSLNIGDGKFIWDAEDGEDASLFEYVSDKVWRRDTFRAFMRLLDNYNASTEHEDRLSKSEVRESYEFLDEIMDEDVMKYVHKYLIKVGKAPTSESAFIKQLFKIWFYSYGRGEARNASSGFEHVFVGELDTKSGEQEVVGLHNWIQFYFLECAKKLDYRGYVLPRKRGGGDSPDGDEQYLSVQFKWEGEVKPVSGMFVGVSPEFEFALYTLLYYCGEDHNDLELGDMLLNVRVYRLDRIGCISSAFPENRN
eukprot:CAMPEP_0117654760 /NCGR_PEP_ID=MMETSP0804-20121206/3918_1 /TAXON_ID=1074897 /ORGANISM="Tetraselmis astigmatica, Strain CCMP880" /LENGTH=310 /DNA_ID=CAMNT_0005461067 /DNA_START=310 /DNA_END=1242 /DNA_ORIENTATION=-